MKNILLNKFQALKKWSLKNEVELQKVSEKIELQEQKIKDLKSNQFQKKDKDIKIELEKEKDNTDFLKKVYKVKSDLSPNIGFDNDNFSEKIKEAEKIETDIGDVRNESKKIDLKIDDLSTNNLTQTQKDKLFEEIEKDILNLKSAVEKLRDENQNLKIELELLIEKNKIERQKSGLEKENSNLKDKLESLKNKTQNSKNEFESDSKNKITYSNSKDTKKIQEYQTLENKNEKER
ncbi:hypothetical protein AN286_05395 [Aliarcobacter cryaerophilus ATCC 43158]|uniref:Uncharacterized protein n=1 Tax=Aliarcobacter cryaerophilus ATCC 43158 TaxID=1032070 RepID=A0AAD0TSF3_9BACT|nr:hypothetical protein [Aliarcobacter cryaerophilus]AYJ79604.1 hypothetical protein ACRYA_0454 [Aliarcobacter cryaerophilus ATCC 43158]PRM95177.1 hypothetical protein CJ667_09115 [Aliarcobacter cryaerophilus]QCZ23849.1 hypothetical protein AN286_05395 [Aliarcobacter cryaerophilus ATCC 43158]